MIEREGGMLNKIKKAILTPNGYAKYLGVNMGSRCKLNKSISFGSEPYLITIGDDFYCSNGVTFITHDGAVNVLRNIYDDFNNADVFGRVEVRNNVFIGCNVTILAGSVIEDNVIVGAGSLVKGLLKSNSVFAGVPARKIMSLDEYKNNVIGKIHKTKNLSSLEKMRYLLEVNL